MRELNDTEIEKLSGGVGLLGAGIGAAIGAGSAYASGGSFGEIVGGGLLGGASGFFGGIATSSFAPTFARASFGAFSVETGILSSAVGSGS